MNRYLLFDSGCSTCSGISKSIREITGSALVPRSLREPMIREMLDKVRTGWKWEPMVLEHDGEVARVFSGLHMKLRLLRVLGIRKAFKVAKLVGRHLLAAEDLNSERRDFLSKSLRGAAVLGAFWIGADALLKVAEAGPNGPSSIARSKGVVSYEQVYQDLSELRAVIKHREASRSGTVQFVRNDNGSRMTLIRGTTMMTVVTNRHGQVTITDFNGRQAQVAFSLEENQWLYLTPESKDVVDDNATDISLMGAVVNDFPPSKPNTSRSSKEGEFTIAVVDDGGGGGGGTIPKTCVGCVGTWGGGTCLDVSRSWACYCATNELAMDCWNQWCIGCCELLECDCVCLKDDAVCYCSRRGRRCDTFSC